MEGLTRFPEMKEAAPAGPRSVVALFVRCCLLDPTGSSTHMGSRIIYADRDSDDDSVSASNENQRIPRQSSSIEESDDAADTGQHSNTLSAQERDVLRARVFELENRLRETEEELEYYFKFYQKAKKEKSRGSTPGASSSNKQQPSTRGVSKNRDGGDMPGRASEESQARSDSSDSDVEDGAAPGNQNYTGESTTATPPRRAPLSYGT